MTQNSIALNRRSLLVTSTATAATGALLLGAPGIAKAALTSSNNLISPFQVHIP